MQKKNVSEKYIDFEHLTQKGLFSALEISMRVCHKSMKPPLFNFKFSTNLISLRRFPEQSVYNMYSLTC